MDNKHGKQNIKHYLLGEGDVSSWICSHLAVLIHVHLEGDVNERLKTGMTAQMADIYLQPSKTVQRTEWLCNAITLLAFLLPHFLFTQKDLSILILNTALQTGPIKAQECEGFHSSQVPQQLLPLINKTSTKAEELNGEMSCKGFECS